MTTGDAHGVLFNVDSVLRLGSPRRQLARLRALRTTSLRDRRSVLAMPRLVRALSADLNSAPVFYLTAFPIVLAKPITALLKRDGYPSGTLLTTGRSFTARWVFGGSRTRKLAGLEHLAHRMPNLRWVLLGDDGGHDPHVFVDFAHRYRDRVAVIALRQVIDVDSPRINLPSRPGGAVGAAVVGAPNGEELLPLVRAAVGIGQPREGSATDWFLSELERGNEATRLRRVDRGQRGCARSCTGASTTTLLADSPGRDGRRRLDPVRGVAGRFRPAPRRRRADGRRGADRGGPSWRAGARAAVARARGHGGIAGRSEPDPRPRRQPGRRRGVAGPAGAPVRLPPPEDGRHPPCRPPPGRRGVHRRHRPRPRQPRRRRSPRRPAERGSRSGLRTQPGLPRPAAATAGPGGAGGRGDVPGAVAEPGAGDAAALARHPGPDPRPPPHRVTASPGPTRPTGRRDLRGPALADLPAPSTPLPLRPAGGTQHRPGLHQGGRPGRAADLPRGPVPVVVRRRAHLRRRPPAARRGCS